MTNPYLNMNNEPNPQIDFTIHVEKTCEQTYFKKVLEHNIKVNETQLKLKRVESSELEEPQIFIVQNEKEIPLEEGHEFGNVLYDMAIKGALDYLTGDNPIRVNIELES